MNLNGQIDWNDADRIVSNDTRYVALGGDWWRESSTWQTRQNGSPELTCVGRSRTRLDAALGGNQFHQVRIPGQVVVSVDALGNETTTRTVVDRTTHTTIQTTITPASSLAAETVVRCGLAVSSRSATGVTTTYAYDALGRQIAQTDGRGNTTQIIYDAQGRVAKTIDPLGNETTYANDALGRQVAVTDPLGHTVTTAYDAEGRVLAQRGATYPVDYAYDAYGNKVSMTTYRNEALTDGDTTRWLYDEPSGCMTNKLYADGKGPRYDYTPDGKLARRTWARGIATDYTYDNAGNLTRTEYNDNGVTPTITMSYDRVGNLVNATTVGVVTNLYAYDIVGHCTNEWQNDFNLTRYYDTLGRSTGYAINGTRQTTIAYDTYGRIATMCMAEGRSGVLTASNENEFVWSYLPKTDLKASLLYPNGITASWTYDANNQLLQVCNATPTNVISQFDYTYDAAGRRIAIAKSGSAFGDLSGSVDAYTYNARSELISARRTKNGQPIPGFSEDFDYDPIGNRRASATYNEKGEAQTSTYEANNLNQYTTRTTPGYVAVRGEADPNATVTVNENPTFRLGSYYFGSDLFDNNSAGGLANLETYATLAQTAANGEEAEDLVSAESNLVYIAQSPEPFTYDDDGNLFRDDRFAYAYDAKNRLLSVRPISPTEGDLAVANRYDYKHRRIEKVVERFDGEAWQIVETHTFVYDGGNIVLEKIALSDGKTRTVEYFWGNDLSGTEHGAGGVGGLVAVSVNGVFFIPCYAHNGNIVCYVSESGTIAAQYVYDSHGNVIEQHGTLAGRFAIRFSTKYTDVETDLISYLRRFYRPNHGRWLNRDPIEEEGGVNLYAYVDNAVICSFDVSGLVPYHIGSEPPPKTVTLDRTTWNSMPGNSGLLIRLRARATAVGGNIAAMPDAAAHLRHFLDNSGTEYTIRFSQMNNDSANAKAHLIRELNDAMNYAEQLAGSYGKVTMVTTQEASASNGSGNWLFAVGRYRTWAVADVVACGDKYYMDWTFNFRDVYDWDMNNGLGGGWVSDREMGLLHRYGVAREYEMVGSQTISIKWERGERVNAGAEILPPSFKDPRRSSK